MNKKLILGLSTALGLSIIGNGIFLLDSGQSSPDQLVAGSVELSGGSKSPLVAAINQSGASGEVICERGVISNMPDRTYCTDGKTAGFILTVQAAAALVSETESKLPGMVSDSLTLQIDEVGKLYVSSKGVKDVEK